MKFHDLAREYTATTGTSDCVLTTAVPGCNTWALAGVVTGQVVRYGIITYSTTNNQPTHSEVGQGTYTSATKTLARTTVESSTNAGAKIVLTGLSEVFIMVSAKDLNTGVNPFASYYQAGAATSVTNTTSDATLDMDTEWVDANALSALAADTVTITPTGWYMISGHVSVGAGAAFNGYIGLHSTQHEMVKGIYATADAILADTLVLPPTLIQNTTTTAVTIKLDNFSGQTVTATVIELTIIKMSEL